MWDISFIPWRAGGSLRPRDRIVDFGLATDRRAERLRGRFEEVRGSGSDIIRSLSGRDCSHRANSHGELNLADVSSSLGMKTSSTMDLLGFSSAIVDIYIYIYICSIRNHKQGYSSQNEGTATQGHQWKSEYLATRGDSRVFLLFIRIAFLLTISMEQISCLRLWAKVGWRLRLWD